MDKAVGSKRSRTKAAEPTKSVRPTHPSREQAEAAVRTLIQWAGDDPDREGWLETPTRVVNAYRDWFSGYESDPSDYLRRTFEEVGGYDEMVVLRDIPFESHCEHHMAPIIGKAHIAYLPRNHVVGISKLARVLHGFARRLQVQERLTAEVADCIWENLKPLGVAVNLLPHINHMGTVSDPAALAAIVAAVNGG